MLSRTRTSLLSLAVIAVLIFSAISPSIAYADGGKRKHPPKHAKHAQTTETTIVCASDGTVTDTPTSGNDSSGQVTDTSSSVSDTSGCTSDGTVTDTTTNGSDPSEAIAETADITVSDTQLVEPLAEAVTPPADTTTLDQVPDNTTVTVLDAQGQSEPLATQEAANAIATTSDPFWCSTTQINPAPGAVGCTGSFPSFTALLTALSGNATYSGAGTIFVEQGAYSGGETTIDFNSYNLSNISSSDLTLQGGWNTTTNMVDPTSTSNFTVPILIGTSTNPWGGSLIINNISISDPNQTGLTLYSQNDITLTSVQVTNSLNGSGAELNAGGNVTINTSKFLRNKTAGAIIKAGGNVAIANSEFSNPVDALRQITGLDITSNGSVSLFNVLANNNRQAGAKINALGRVSISTSVFSGNKSVNGTTFYGYGLQVVTPNAIDLANVTANDNFLWGASLKAGQDLNGAGVNIADSVFNHNITDSTTFIDDTGLLINSVGTVSLNNVQANENRLIGAVIDSGADVSINNSSFSSNKGVTLNSGGAPTFHGYGLQVTSKGSIFLGGVTASNNTLFGAHLEASGDVLIADSNFSNQGSGSVTNPTGRGLEVISGGSVFLTNVVMDHNELFGGNIQTQGDVFLNGVTATNNSLDGVSVTGNCTTVYLTNGIYSNNGQYGLSIINAALNQSGSPVFTNNGLGNIFQDPGTCVFASSGNNAGSSILTSYSANAFDSSLLSTSLNGILLGATSKTASGVTSIFLGKYIYVYPTSGGVSSIDGIQIIAFHPVNLTEIAMGGS
jgi:hypothetical protein